MPIRSLHYLMCQHASAGGGGTGRLVPFFSLQDNRKHGSGSGIC